MPEISALGLRFKSPIIVASTDIARTAGRFEDFAASGAGGIVTKSVTDAPALQDAGIAYAIDQIVDLVTDGVDGIHLYTMNNPYVARKISEAVSGIIKAAPKC